jgi:hypothetical protein
MPSWRIIRIENSSATTTTAPTRVVATASAISKPVMVASSLTAQRHACVDAVARRRRPTRGSTLRYINVAAAGHRTVYDALPLRGRTAKLWFTRMTRVWATQVMLICNAIYVVR